MELAPAAKAQTFGKYSLVAKLATGGMAEIFLARLQGSAGFEKLVCIKRILPHLAQDPHLVGMFLSEAKIAAQISHPNVCSVFELGEIDGGYFIAMEYLEGVPLSCFRRRDMYPRDTDPRLVVGLGMQACEGLHHAHQLKKADGSPLEVVHRDVSANNLFATVHGVVKVLDFGIAKVQDASVRTSTGSVKGTYAYMAPEQLRSERVDRRTDVFALGIVMWEMLAREHLFKRENEFLTFQAITTDPIPDVTELRPDVPPAVAAVIAKALSRSRDDRYPTARAMGEALAQSVATLGGPLSVAAISDEINTAFEARLSEQRALIRIAREGGALALDKNLGPAVGHGTELITTPVSIASGESSPISKPQDKGTGDTVVLPAPDLAFPPIPTRIPPGPRSETMSVVPLKIAPARRPSWVVPVAVLALCGVAAAILFVTRTPSGGAASTHDAGVAPVIAVIPDAASTAVQPVDAAAVATPPTTPPNPPVTPKPPATPPRPNGPPGFITIDSSPSYAVIYIDGKKLGETPLAHVALAPGKHVVRAVSASGTSRTFGVTIESGKVAPTRRLEW